MCTCPPQIPAPSEQIKFCRLLIRILMIGFVVLSVFAILLKDIFLIINHLIQILILFMASRNINCCMMLMIFLYSILMTILQMISTASVIKVLAEGQKVTDTLVIIVVMASFVIYLIIVPVSHYVYRHFKAESPNGAGGFSNLMAGMGGGGARMMPQNDNQPYNRMNQSISTESNRQADNLVRFPGQGVTIG